MYNVFYFWNNVLICGRLLHCKLTTVNKQTIVFQSNQVKRTPLEYINEMIIWKLNPFIRFNSGGIMRSDRKPISTCLLPEILYRCHFWSKKLKNEYIIPASLKRINGSIFK